MTDTTSSAAEFWENRYSESGKSWSGKVNVALEHEIAGIKPGTALDLGCGEGGDALWLAHNGWAVTAVDISPSALAIGAAAQAPDDDITWVPADLATWVPPTTFDLVTSCFLHSFMELPREIVLRRAAVAVAPGGLLLIVGHSGRPHWGNPDGPEHDHEHEVADLPTPEEVQSSLFDNNPKLDSQEWVVLTSARIERPVLSPDGSPSTIADSVLKLQRSAIARSHPTPPESN